MRVIAAARALPVQARRLSRRNLVFVGARRLVARKPPLAVPADRAAPAPAGRGRLAGQCGRDGLTKKKELACNPFGCKADRLSNPHGDMPALWFSIRLYSAGSQQR